MRRKGVSRMSLIRYEFRKLISYTYVRAAFALLLVITAVLCAFECSRETVELRDDTITALELYGENRDFYDKYANELKALNDEYIKVEISEIKMGILITNLRIFRRLCSATSVSTISRC